MTQTEVDLAGGRLDRSGQDSAATLIRTVRDLARLRRVLAGAPGIIERGAAEAVLFRLSLRSLPTERAA